MIDDFNDWLGDLPHSHKILTAGNHDYPIEADPDRWRRRISNGELLLNESIIVGGLHIFCSPCTTLYSGAFGLSSEADREHLYASIPEGTHILVTHGPPAGILDAGQGCAALRRAVARIRPRIHCFGHVHSAYGTLPTTRTMFLNAALLDKDGAPTHKPILIDLKT